MKHFLTFTIFLSAFILSGQTIHYDYDASGNREFRYTVYLRTAPLDSTDTFTSEREALTEEEELLGMEESWDAITMRVYPNPTAHSIQVEMSGEDLPQGEELRLMNMSGQLIRQQKQFHLPLNIDMHDCPAGGYILWMKFSDGTVKRVKILKT